MPSPLIVILAGGANSRFWPLRGKSLLRFCGKTLIEHQLDAFFEAGCEDAIVVANPETYDDVRTATARYGERVSVPVQETPRGMGDALLVAGDAAGGRLYGRAMLVTQSHDVVDPELYASTLSRAGGTSGGAIVGQEVEEYFPGGYLALRDERVVAVVEKPPKGSEPSRYVNLVIHLHRDPRRLLELVRQVYASESQTDDHYERALTLICAEQQYHLVPYSGAWQPIKYPWHVLGAMDLFLQRLPEPSGPLPEGVRGRVVLEDGVRIFPGGQVAGPAYIGAGTLIGTGALVRGSMVGQGCEVGFASEVARSYLGDACLLHHSYAGDSVLEGNVSFGFGTVTGNSPFYPPPVRAFVKGERLRTEMDKLGAIVGSEVRTGIGVLLHPGVKIGRKTFVGPGVVVTKDMPENQLVLVRQELIERDNPFDYIPPR